MKTPRLFTSTDQIVAALEERVRKGCEMMMREVHEIPDFVRLKAELKNWEALNYTFLSGNFTDRSYARKYYALISEVPDVVLDAVSEKLHERLEEQLTFLAAIREQLTERDAESAPTTLVDLVMFAAAAARHCNAARLSIAS